MIKHQTQPTFNSCVMTCVAMLLNVPAQQLVDEYHDEYWSAPDKLPELLEAKGLGFEFRCANEMSVYYGNVYLATVPSINTPGNSHQIIIDARNDDFIVYDPAEGREGRKCYTYHRAGVKYPPLRADQVLLESWNLDWRISHAPAIGIGSELGAGDHRWRAINELKEFARGVSEGLKDVGILARVEKLIADVV